MYWNSFLFSYFKNKQKRVNDSITKDQRSFSLDQGCNDLCYQPILDGSQHQILDLNLSQICCGSWRIPSDNLLQCNRS